MQPIPAVQAFGLGKKYDGRWVLRDLTFALASGQFHVLMGRNGSGKSTLLRLIAGVESPNAGDAAILGHRMGKWDSPFRDGLYSVSEDWAMPSKMSLGRFGKTIGPLYSRWEPSIYQRWLEHAGVKAEDYLPEISRGQRMQVACGFALATKPNLLLLDEVTAVLDSKARARLIDELRTAVDAGMTLVLATNLVFECHHAVDTVLALSSGQVWVQSPLEQLKDSKGQSIGLEDLYEQVSERPLGGESQ